MGVPESSTVRLYRGDATVTLSLPLDTEIFAEIMLALGALGFTFEPHSRPSTIKPPSDDDGMETARSW